MSNFQIENDAWEHGIPMTEENMAKFGWAKVVRCRDCAYFNRMNDDEGMCMVPDGDGDYKRWMVDGDGFCYEGERRDA